MDIDPSAPEQRPDEFQLGHCAVCWRCFLSKSRGHCVGGGGPFNGKYEFDLESFVPIKE